VKETGMRDANGADGELLWRYTTNGCERSFALVVARHAVMVHGVCRRVATGGGVDADDVAQVVFATLARRAASLTTYPSVAGWLHRTAWNEASRHRRAAASRGRHERAAGEYRLAVAAVPAADPLDGEVVKVEVHRAVNALPDPFHVPVVLHDLQGWTIAEVADLLGSPPGTVAAQVSRGRKLVRDRLDRRGFPLTSAAVAAVLAADRASGAAAGGGAAVVPPTLPAPGAGPAPGLVVPVAAVGVAVVGMGAASAWTVGVRAGTASGGLGAGIWASGASALGAGVSALANTFKLAGGAWGTGPAVATALALLLVGTLGVGAARVLNRGFTAASDPAGTPAYFGQSASAWSRNGGSEPATANKSANSTEKAQVPTGTIVVPEPASAAVASAAGLALFARRPRRGRPGRATEGRPVA
jgi:RNA polymerase sigma factor (sigma-70 family)